MLTWCPLLWALVTRLFGPKDLRSGSYQFWNYTVFIYLSYIWLSWHWIGFFWFCFCYGDSNDIRRGADKSLARPGRKQATATKLGIYTTYFPRSTLHFLTHCSNFCKPLKKKNSEGCPYNQVFTAAMTSASDEKWRPFSCFFFSVVPGWWLISTPVQPFSWRWTLGFETPRIYKLKY